MARENRGSHPLISTTAGNPAFPDIAESLLRRAEPARARPGKSNLGSSLLRSTRSKAPREMLARFQPFHRSDRRECGISGFAKPHRKLLHRFHTYAVDAVNKLIDTEHAAIDMQMIGHHLRPRLGKFQPHQERRFELRPCARHLLF